MMSYRRPSSLRIHHPTTPIVVDPIAAIIHSSLRPRFHFFLHSLVLHPPTTTTTSINPIVPMGVACVHLSRQTRRDGAFLHPRRHPRRHPQRRHANRYSYRFIGRTYAYSARFFGRSADQTALFSPALPLAFAHVPPAQSERLRITLRCRQEPSLRDSLGRFTWAAPSRTATQRKAVFGLCGGAADMGEGDATPPLPWLPPPTPFTWQGRGVHRKAGNCIDRFRAISYGAARQPCRKLALDWAAPLYAGGKPPTVPPSAPDPGRHRTRPPCAASAGGCAPPLDFSDTLSTITLASWSLPRFAPRLGARTHQPGRPFVAKWS